MDPSQAQPSPMVTIRLRSHRKSKSSLPPYPLAKLPLVVEIRTQEQGLTDRPVMTRQFSISELLKPESIDLPTDHILACHISFDSFCRKVKNASNVKFDAALDELVWVQEPQRPEEKQKLWGISCELIFQNALGMMQLATSQSETPQALILHLWSPAPKETMFRRSRRTPVPEGCSAGDGLESKANSQQPSSSTMPLVINPALNQFGGADADVKMTILTTPVATQPKNSESVQSSTNES